MTSPYHTTYHSRIRAVDIQSAGCCLVQEEDAYGRAVGAALEFPTYEEAVKFVQGKQHSPWLNGPAHGPKRRDPYGETLWFTDVYTADGRFIRTRTWHLLWG
ncbi:hypothetical protein [Deinococcus aluminii]|uniref:Uncharacterized protein n=1 Tax=Deinococcus aluminii TaxID=1656885 RepID=A0ABP9XG71_9DEIO